MIGGGIIGRGGSEVDPDKLDAAARDMRKMAVRLYRAGDEMESAYTDRAGDDYIFGRSEQAQELARKWDAIIRRRNTQTEDIGTSTQELAEDLERAADKYRGSEDERRRSLSDIGEGIGP